MHARINATGRSALKLDTSFEAFLGGRAMSTRAKHRFCEPEDLILDHLPGFPAQNDEELAEAFAEACEQATDGSLSKVSLSENDIAFVRRHFLHSRRFRYVMPMPPEAA